MTPAVSPPAPWSDADLARLDALLDALPAPLEPLDAAMTDGFLCGVLLQPSTVPTADWWPRVLDVDGRAPPAGLDLAPLQALVLRRHRELAAAIDARHWFDPWVFELEADDDVPGEGGESPSASDAVYPWVAGFVTALDLFPGLLALDPARTLEPLALVYRHLAPDDLEDADELLAAIDALEPPAGLDDAVEDLVQATLLLADVVRPAAAAVRSSPGRRRPPSGRSAPPRRGARGGG